MISGYSCGAGVLMSSSLVLLGFLFDARAVPPGVSVEGFAEAGGPYTVAAEGTVTLDASASRTSACTRVQYDWDVDGDGTVDVAAGAASRADWTAAGVDGPWSTTVSLVVTCYVSSGLTVEDKDGARLTVNNVAPSIVALETSGTLREGSEVTLTVEASDVEAADLLTVTWDLGDGSSLTGATITHTWVQDGDYDVVISVTDDDGGRATRTQRLRVVNAPPEIEGEPSTRAFVDQLYTFTPSAHDPGALDELNWTVALPDGAVFDPTTRQISWQPTADQLGDHRFEVVVRDDAGDSDTLSWIVEVLQDGEDTGGTGDGGPADGGQADGGGDRPWGDGSADPDPWDDWEIQGEGCRCRGGSAALLLPAVLPLIGLRRRSLPR